MVIFGIDFTHLIVTYGPFAIFAVLFAESALVFFLPGDSFLFVAGILAAQGHLGFWSAVMFGLVGAVLGNNVGYWIGKKFGAPLFEKERSFLFHKDHINKVHEYYEKYGPMTVVLARFIPGVRTLAPIAAGIGEMDYWQFLTFNVSGALLWLLLILTTGYFLGSVIPSIDRYILPIIFAVIIISVIPGAVAYYKNKKK